MLLTFPPHLKRKKKPLDILIYLLRGCLKLLINADSSASLGKRGGSPRFSNEKRGNLTRFGKESCLF